MVGYCRPLSTYGQLDVGVAIDCVDSLHVKVLFLLLCASPPVYRLAPLIANIRVMVYDHMNMII